MMNKGIQRRLNKHIPTVLIGGIFMTFCIVFILSMCNIQHCEDKTYAIAHHRMDRQQGQGFWRNQFLAPSKDLQAKLVILILTGPDNNRQRDTIRDTWLNNVSLSVLVKFVIGVANLTDTTKRSIEREDFVHKDILFLKNYQESYNTLTEKLLQSLIWFDQHVDFKYLLKVDDDSFVRLDQLFQELASKPVDRLYWGFFNGRAHVKRMGKWAETSWVLCDRYLPYALGGGYVISVDLVHYVVTNQLMLKKFISEDVSLGTWLAPLDIQRIHDPRFDTEYVSRGCQNVYIITHKKSISEMRDLHHNIKTSGKLCSKEKRVRKSYIYNWNVLPLECCIRNDSIIP